MRLACLLAALASPAIADQTVRFATFNASLNRGEEGAMAAELAQPGSKQPASVAEVIQRVRPDVLLINEIDGGTEAFVANYLAVSQNGADPLTYAYIYVPTSNTGLLSGHDLNADGTTATEADKGSFAYANDSHGFGQFPGQYGMAILSRFPIDTDAIRTFQTFKWADMPGGLLTTDPALRDFYSAQAAATLRLSSKTHADVPIRIGSATVHLLAAHPTPPVFDGPEDRNGKRNHDEIRFWADYVSGQPYMTDDNGQTGALADGAAFVIAGDYNADPFDGDSYNNAIVQLLSNPAIAGSPSDGALTPGSDGGPAAAEKQTGPNATHTGDPRFDTADFGFNPDTPGTDGAPGNLRVDYVLPSRAGLTYETGGVYWLTEDDAHWPLSEYPTSDHRLTWIDVTVHD